MELEGLQRHWHAFGEQDPLWAILSSPGKRGGAWDLDEFFATGRAEVADVLSALAQREIAIEHGRALDFGCGVGRLTQGLAHHFQSCDGVDVAASMIERAQALNPHGERIRFHHNPATDLGLFADGSFDFVLSLLVLQHMEPALMRGYLEEFMRVLRPGGVAFFNIPERAVLAQELPPEAWRASLTLNGELPSLTPGRIAPLELTVRNDAQAVWPATAQVGIGNHWRPIDGAEVVFDHARAMIDEDLAPGRERNLRLEVMPPAKPGDYVLEIDLVQEWISWFADRGSTPLRIEVTVTAAPSTAEDRELVAERGQAAEQGGPFTPTMEMHAMPREEVAAALEDAGGVLREAIASARSTPSFPSVEYIVVRDTAPFKTPTRRRPPDDTSERRATGPAPMDEPGDLLGFSLTSRSRRLARLSVLLRGILRRAMREVLHRQSEFNRASAESNRRLEREMERLAVTLESQEARIADLDRKLARSERQDQ